jgi:predicted outer membrane protein
MKLPKILDDARLAGSSRIVFAVALILSLIAVLTVWQDPQIVARGYKDVESGPIGASDRDLLYKVKQAGLWEMPVGHELATKSTSPAVRAMGAQISVEHMQLDEMTDRLAKKLDVALPSAPTPDQQSWINELSEMPAGAEYDRKAAFYLRRAHGFVLPLLANVKAGTRNDEIREFATIGMTFVSRHMKYLDESGLIDFSELPEPPTPSPYQQPNVASYWDSHDARTMVVSAIVILVLGALLASIVVPLIKSRPKKVVKTGKRRRT